MQLLIAINFSEATRDKIILLREGLRARSTQGNFTTDDNLRLVLAHIDNCSPYQIDAFKAAMDKVCFEPFTMAINNIRYRKFQTGHRWWVDMEDREPLLALQREIARKFAADGFRIESRRYKMRIRLGGQVFSDAGPRKIKRIKEEVSAIHLLKPEQEQVPDVPVYSNIHTRSCLLAEAHPEGAMG